MCAKFAAFDEYENPSNGSDELSLMNDLIPRSYNADLIAEKYKIDVLKPLLELSTEFADAYHADDVSEKNEGDEDNRQYYALIFKKKLPFRFAEIVTLKTCAFSNLQGVIEYGIAEISTLKMESFVVILPRIQGESLHKLCLSGTNLDEHFISRNIIEPMLALLESLHKTGITHGRINPYNIYIDDQGKLTLGECFSDVCGFSQPVFYETTERAQSLKYAKGNGSSKTDYYALGMTIYFMLARMEPEDIETQTIIMDKLLEGTFNYLNKLKFASGPLFDIVKGLVMDDARVRWGFNEVNSVLQGKSYLMTNLVDKRYVNRAIVFNGREHYAAHSLAYDLWLNWEIAKEFIKEEKLKRWLELNNEETNILTVLESSAFGQAKLIRNAIQKIFTTSEERLIKTLIVFDPSAAIRIRNIAFCKEGIGSTLLYGINHLYNSEIKIILHFLSTNLFVIYNHIATFHHDLTYENYTNLFNRCSEFLRKSDVGFGLDRIIYELNPHLPCQSNIFSAHFYKNLSEVMDYLENNEVSFNEILTKKTLSGFVAFKLNINKEAKVQSLANSPILQKSRIFQLLLIFALAQKNLNSKAFPRLCEMFAVHLKEIIDAFIKSLLIKGQVYSKIDYATKTGSLEELLKASTNSSYIEKDLVGYPAALKQAALIAKEIFTYQTNDQTSALVRKKSLRFVIKIGYILCCLLLIKILFQHS